MTEPTYELRPVGVVRSPCRRPGELRPGGIPAEIEVDADYEPALDDIERGTHVVVMGFLHLADRSVLVGRRRTLDPPGPHSGVFACRSPARPNPVSLTVCRLVRREGRRLLVDPLDLVDGTPIVDLKPYCPGWDGVYCARREPRIPVTADPVRLADLLARDLRNHVGDEAAATPEARQVLASVLAAACELGVDPRDPRLTVCCNRLGVVADALQGLTGATFGGGRLVVELDSRPLSLRFVLADRVLAR